VIFRQLIIFKIEMITFISERRIYKALKEIKIQVQIVWLINGGGRNVLTGSVHTFWNPKQKQSNFQM